MLLYDGKSSINWVYHGEMTKAEMVKDPELKALTEVPCILFDDGAGRVYSWKYLSALAAQYGVEQKATPEETFAAIQAAMQLPPRDALTELDEHAAAIEELAAMLGGEQ